MPSIAIALVLVIIVIIGLIFIIPLVTAFFVKAFMNNKIFKGLGSLVVKNISSSRNILNNITLLIIGISSLLMKISLIVLIILIPLMIIA